MVSTPSTRRVLSDLNVNTPTTRTAGALFPKGTTSSPQKPGTLGKGMSSHTSTVPNLSLPAPDEAQTGNKKRYGTMSPDIQQPFLKRRKTPSSVQHGPELATEVPAMEESYANCKGVDSRIQPKDLEPHQKFDESSPLVPVSPSSSSFEFSVTEMNESQNTIITEPDNVPDLGTYRRPSLPLTTPPLTPSQLREKARAIKLRLTLASYKVRTNQIDIPISRLQIRSCSSSPKTSSLPRANTSQRRTPFPTATESNLSNIQLQKPSAEMKQAQTTLPSSSPPRPYRENMLVSPIKDDSATRDGLATPILPRQKEGILNPPTLNSPIWEDEKGEITSSVVKGRAANGLLKLMHQ